MNAVDPTVPFGHKIQPRQRDRLAIVYIRQSTAHQVDSNRESADLQYQLRHRALTLGWADERVLVIDDDQGVSGTSVENRPGFQRLLAEVSLGHVGIVVLDLDPVATLAEIDQTELRVAAGVEDRVGHQLAHHQQDDVQLGVGAGEGVGDERPGGAGRVRVGGEGPLEDGLAFPIRGAAGAVAIDRAPTGFA